MRIKEEEEKKEVEKKELFGKMWNSDQNELDEGSSKIWNCADWSSGADDAPLGGGQPGGEVRWLIHGGVGQAVDLGYLGQA